MTPTGSDMVRRHQDSRIHHAYVPYDLPGALARFLKRVQPKLIIIMETELWPNTLHLAQKQQIPVMLANARLSARSARGYSYIRSLTRKMLSSIHLIAAQSQEDADRFIKLGALPNRVCVFGSIKFDMQTPKDLIQQGKLLRASWDIDRPVWIAASTHQKEEEIILQAFKKIRQKLPTALLILVPRHPERFKEVAQLCLEENFNLVKRSEGIPCSVDTAIFLGDTLGELFLYYAAADVAFVAGSLIPIGGHNLLEPAALELPVISGPHLANFNEISKLLKDADALRIVQNEQELAEQVIYLLMQTKERQRLGQNAKHVVEANRGAVTKHLAWIETQLNLR
jgi:3-deoxy-D-manno-octulosonic-acid transferase